MKIDRPGSKIKDTAAIAVKEGEKKVSSAPGSKFSSLMEKADDQGFDDRMKKLAEDIFEQGERLAKKIDVRDLKVYKSLIAEFLNEVTNNSHRFDKKSKMDRRGRLKVFVTVKNINEEVDSLTNEMLSKQADNIKILKKIEDIRGMILDLQL